MSAPGGLVSTGNQKPSSLFFCSRGKEKHAGWSVSGDEERHAARRVATIDLSLTASSPCEKASQWSFTELSVQRRRKHPSTEATGSSTPWTLAWLSLAPTCQTKQEDQSLQTWNSTSFRVIVIIKYEMCLCPSSTNWGIITWEVCPSSNISFHPVLKCIKWKKEKNTIW